MELVAYYELNCYDYLYKNYFYTVVFKLIKMTLVDLSLNTSEYEI